MYSITPRSKKIAKENNLTIKPSNDGRHKIDVYKNNKFITAVGALGYGDYPTYLEMEKTKKKPKGYAESRKKLYVIRHEKDLKTLRGKLANLILWS